ncbi:hypothetical protein [Niabella sp.]|uniref:hypothetical protein n=1 Tax=Niabella sp. TaxID=1962976 RepID=UPI0026096284|nr:hypothetical protein [Niabella sp.]
MLRLLLICSLFVFPSFQYGNNNSSQGKKERGWLIFKESGGVLFAQDSLPERIRSGAFFNKYQYLKGIDVSNNGSIYEFEKYATTYEAIFWGNKNKEDIKILPVQVEVYSRKKSFDPEQNAWSFKRIKDSTIVLYNFPDTLYVSNICPYKKKTGDCYEAQICSK